MSTAHHRDLIIMGGGLAGLSLAYEITSHTPDIDILVIEKATFPRAQAIAKVGESTVEIGSHYLSHTLDLADHLKKSHLKKFGIRMFFGETSADFAQLDELGASQSFGIPTYQIDRGDIENQLVEKVRARGVEVIDGANCTIVSQQPGAHTIRVSSGDTEENVTSRWLVDASGRQGILKTQNQLARTNSHQSNAIWFRVDKRIEIDGWTPSTTWQDRCTPRGHRWLSTNHLVGPGYWVWIIPLAADITSIGIVLDDSAFASAKIQCQRSAMDWLHKNQGRCAEAIGDAKFLDFVVIQDYSYDCKQIFSDDGWALTGEAGRFADPLYSPGSDFIAINNGFIRELICAGHKGADTRIHRALFEKIFHSIYENTLSLYTHQYGGFGDRALMGLKLLWDYSYYWGVLSLLFFDQALTNLPRLRQLNPLLEQAKSLNQAVQAQFRQRAASRLVLPSKGLFLDQYNIPCLQYFNDVLKNTDGESTHSHLTTHVAMLAQLADATQDMLSDNPTLTPGKGESALIGDYRKLILA